MSNTRKDWHPKPVKRIELSEDKVVFRIILVAVLLVIAVSAITFGVMSAKRASAGWQEINVDSASFENCGEDFILLYNLGTTNESATMERKGLVVTYTAACEYVYQIFNDDVEIAGVRNLYYINHHPNEDIQIDETLYNAFALLKEYGNENIYLAPIYEQLDDAFFAGGDDEAALFDPYKNEQVRNLYQEDLAYIRNRDEVELELKGDNTVCLKVSKAYEEYAKDNGFESYIDLFWMKNAFAVDYLAETLTQKGYTLGSISSFDGFMHNLDDSGTEYSVNVYDYHDGNPVVAAVMKSDRACSTVYLRNYMMNDSRDIQFYYEYADGNTINSYVDINDGLYKTSADNLFSYSYDKSCAQMLMELCPIYVSNDFDAQKLFGLKDMYSIYIKDCVLFFNDEKLELKDLLDTKEGKYSTSFVN